MKPLCELCGDRHEAHQAHRFANTPKPAWITPVVDNGNMDNSRTYRYRDQEKRRAQMREVMRRRRQRLKAA